MKKFIGYILLTLIVASCGTDSGHFQLEGRFQNFNQGEFYIYSPSGAILGLDTIHVADGRFSYNIPLDNKATFIVVFPNYSEQAIIGEPGATVKMQGNASNLKEIEIEGTEDNEALSKFRKAANRMTPPEVEKEVERFVAANPTSPACLYLVQKYFLQCSKPNYEKALALLDQIEKADRDNGNVMKVRTMVKSMNGCSVGKQIPSFTSIDTQGKNIGKIQLKGKVNVVSVWASWNYDSQNIQRRLRKLKKEYGSDLAIISVCIDGSKEQCQRMLRSDSVNWSTVCDGKMWETPMLKQLGISTVPANIVARKDGQIVALNLTAQEIEDKVRTMIK